MMNLLKLVDLIKPFKNSIAFMKFVWFPEGSLFDIILN